jgi:hypothetical protein
LGKEYDDRGVPVLDFSPPTNQPSALGGCHRENLKLPQDPLMSQVLLVDPLMKHVDLELLVVLQCQLLVEHWYTIVVQDMYALGDLRGRQELLRQDMLGGSAQNWGHIGVVSQAEDQERGQRLAMAIKESQTLARIGQISAADA